MQKCKNYFDFFLLCFYYLFYNICICQHNKNGLYLLHFVPWLYTGRLGVGSLRLTRPVLLKWWSLTGDILKRPFGQGFKGQTRCKTKKNYTFCKQTFYRILNRSKSKRFQSQFQHLKKRFNTIAIQMINQNNIYCEVNASSIKTRFVFSCYTYQCVSQSKYLCYKTIIAIGKFQAMIDWMLLLKMETF